MPATTIPQLFIHLTDSFKKPALFLYKKDGRYVSISTDEVRRDRHPHLPGPAGPGRRPRGQGDPAGRERPLVDDDRLRGHLPGRRHRPDLHLARPRADQVHHQRLRCQGGHRFRQESLGQGRRRQRRPAQGRAFHHLRGRPARPGRPAAVPDRGEGRPSRRRESVALPGDGARRSGRRISPRSSTPRERQGPPRA